MEWSSLVISSSKVDKREIERKKKNKATYVISDIMRKESRYKKKMR